MRDRKRDKAKDASSMDLALVAPPFKRPAFFSDAEMERELELASVWIERYESERAGGGGG